MEEASRREQLEAAGKRAAAKQPDEIHLSPAANPPWIDPAAVDSYARALRDLGFSEAGAFTIDVLPVTIRFLLKQSDRIYAAIYDHAKAGVWINLIILHPDGTSVTLSNTQDRGLEQRPGHPTLHFHRT